MNRIDVYDFLNVGSFLYLWSTYRLFCFDWRKSIWYTLTIWPWSSSHKTNFGSETLFQSQSTNLGMWVASSYLHHHPCHPSSKLTGFIHDLLNRLAHPSLVTQSHLYWHRFLSSRRVALEKVCNAYCSFSWIILFFENNNNNNNNYIVSLIIFVSQPTHSPWTWKNRHLTSNAIPTQMKPQGHLIILPPINISQPSKNEVNLRWTPSWDQCFPHLQAPPSFTLNRSRLSTFNTRSIPKTFKTIFIINLNWTLASPPSTNPSHNPLTPLHILINTTGSLWPHRFLTLTRCHLRMMTRFNITQPNLTHPHPPSHTLTTRLPSTKTFILPHITGTPFPPLTPATTPPECPSESTPSRVHLLTIHSYPLSQAHSISLNLIRSPTLIRIMNQIQQIEPWNGWSPGVVRNHKPARQLRCHSLRVRMITVAMNFISSNLPSPPLGWWKARLVMRPLQTMAKSQWSSHLVPWQRLRQLMHRLPMNILSVLLNLTPTTESEIDWRPRRPM